MDDSLGRQPGTNQDGQLIQGITKTSLDPIFEESDFLSLQEAYDIALKNGFDPSGDYKKPPKERFRQLFRKVGDRNYGIEKVKDDKGGSAKNYKEF